MKKIKSKQGERLNDSTTESASNCDRFRIYNVKVSYWFMAMGWFHELYSTNLKRFLQFFCNTTAFVL